jgi:hypothetical protein
VNVAVLKVQVDNIAGLTANWKRLRQMSGACRHLVIGPEKVPKPKVKRVVFGLEELREKVRRVYKEVRSALIQTE